ncbi:hypothetical protein [Ferrimicrobium acidiphilum]|uniref:Uncharacterized protein n=1 Tax=Ferrimicrobium acidiphilum TaxID=121039 RepID=A0ABV3Y1E4_9ACTN
MDDIGMIEPGPVVKVEDIPTAIFYTSGPRGVVSTDENLTQTLMNAMHLGARRLVRAGTNLGDAKEQIYSLPRIPLLHVKGCAAVLMPNMAAGAKLVLRRRFDPLEALDRARAGHGTWWGANGRSADPRTSTRSSLRSLVGKVGELRGLHGRRSSCGKSAMPRRRSFLAMVSQRR